MSWQLDTAPSVLGLVPFVRREGDIVVSSPVAVFCCVQNTACVEGYGARVEPVLLSTGAANVARGIF